MCILKGDAVAAADGDEGLSLDAVYQRTSKQQPMILFSLIQRSRWKAVKPRYWLMPLYLLQLFSVKLILVMTGETL